MLLILLFVSYRYVRTINLEIMTVHNFATNMANGFKKVYSDSDFLLISQSLPTRVDGACLTLSSQGCTALFRDPPWNGLSGFDKSDR